MTRLIPLFGAILLSVSLPAPAQTLERIESSGKLRIGYRTDAPPFSFDNELGEPSGYSVQLCKYLGVGLKAGLSLEELDVQYVKVTAEDRFQQIIDDKIDVLCGATTQTLARRRMVDFSIPVFIDGASVMYPAGGPDSFKALAGKKIGVRAGTTTQESLALILEDLQLQAEIVEVESHGDGVEMLGDGKLSAYFADQAILFFHMARSENRENLTLSDLHFTIEPYALAVKRGDTDFRLFVDRVLSRLYRTGKVDEIFVRSFGMAEPSDLVKALYVISALPE